MTQEAATAPETGEGAATISTAGEGNPQGAAPGAEGGSAGWLESLPETLTFETVDAEGKATAAPLREHPKLKQFKGPEDLLKSYLHLEGLVGKKTIGLAPLAENATDEERKAFDAELRRVLNVPEKPDGYDLGIPEGAKLDDAGFSLEFCNWAHAAGLSQQQVSTISQGYQGYAQKFWDGEVAKVKEEKAAAVAGLEKHFGGEKQAAEAVEFAKRGFVQVAREAGLDEKEADAWAKTYGDDPVIVRMFHVLGRQHKEDTNHEGSGGSPAPEENKRDRYAKQFPNA